MARTLPIFYLKKWQNISQELREMLDKNIIEEVDDPLDAYVWNIFTRDKPDDSLRIILGLSLLNERVMYQHPELDNLQQALNFVISNCFMVSLDEKICITRSLLPPHSGNTQLFSGKE